MAFLLTTKCLVTSLLFTGAIFAALMFSSATNAQSIQLQIPVQKQASQDITLCEKTSAGGFECNGIVTYVQAIYVWLLGAVGILVVVSLIFAGFQWTTSRGDKGAITKAKTMMQNSLIGLGLTLGAYVLLWAINPDFVELRPLQLGKQEAIDFTIEIPHASLSEQDSVGRAGGGVSGTSSEVMQLINDRKLTMQCVGPATCRAQKSGRWQSGIQGQGPVPIDGRILGALKIVGDTCPGTSITALNEAGEGHSEGSYHYVGKAVDIGGTICGGVPEACTTQQRQLVDKLLSLGYSVGTPGGRCGGFKDAPGHFHINVR